MTRPSHARRRWGAHVALFVLLASLTGCASTRPVVPPADITAARAAIASAEEAGAAEHAPLELRTARQKFERAQAAADPAEAYFLASQAAIDARLAETTARAARQEANLRTVQASIETLRQEIERNRRAVQGQ
jgi:hypothetical protein